MSDVAIPFGTHVLLLSQEQFNEALRRGKELLPQPTTHTTASDEVLDADGMAQRTGIPASWFLEQARQNELPHLIGAATMTHDKTLADVFAQADLIARYSWRSRQTRRFMIAFSVLAYLIGFVSGVVAA